MNPPDFQTLARALAHAHSETGRLKDQLRTLTADLAARSPLNLAQVLLLLDSKIVAIAQSLEKAFGQLQAGQARLREQVQRVGEKTKSFECRLNPQSKLDKPKPSLPDIQNNSKLIESLLKRVTALETQGRQVHKECPSCRNRGRQCGQSLRQRVQNCPDASLRSIERSGVRKARKRIFPQKSQPRMQTQGAPVPLIQLQPTQKIVTCNYRPTPVTKPECKGSPRKTGRGVMSPAMQDILGTAGVLSPIRRVDERFGSASRGLEELGGRRQGLLEFQDFNLSEGSSSGEDELFYPGTRREESQDEAHSPFNINYE